jgi:hypothetical protein
MKMAHDRGSKHHWESRSASSPPRVRSLQTGLHHIPSSLYARQTKSPSRHRPLCAADNPEAAARRPSYRGKQCISSGNDAGELGAVASPPQHNNQSVFTLEESIGLNVLADPSYILNRTRWSGSLAAEKATFAAMFLPYFPQETKLSRMSFESSQPKQTNAQIEARREATAIFG